MGLIAKLANTPLALEFSWAESYFLSLLASDSVFNDKQKLQEVGEPSKVKAILADAPEPEGYVDYRLVDGVAIIPIVGPLAHRWSWYNWGYRELAGKLIAAKHDVNVRAILLDCETPGGTVSGLPDFARLIKAIDKIKPVFALINDLAASAGMAIASQCRVRFITQNGVAGSIGTVCLHLDHSEFYSKVGVKPTLIYSGVHKVEQNSYQELSKTVIERVQANCDKHRLEFAQLVASNMPLSVPMLLDSEAQCYRGQEAIDFGLADVLVNCYDIVAEINDRLVARFSVSSSSTSTADNTAALTSIGSTMNVSQAPLSPHQPLTNTAVTNTVTNTAPVSNNERVGTGADCPTALETTVLQTAALETSTAAQINLQTSPAVMTVGQSAPPAESITEPVTAEVIAPTASQPSQPSQPVAQAATGAAQTGSSVADERVRIAAILHSESGQKQPKLAQHMAFNTQLSADEVNEILTTSAALLSSAEATVLSAAQVDTGFTAAMAQGNPEVGSDAEETGETDASSQAINEAVGLYSGSYKV